ncbi:hypothetical protein ACRYJU_07250 [Alloalcanivorax xenomutans]|uniref:hypothetical protein n=1 Tax=Alloalcanivorax xenomutans TaxID=1094342 RepID=UPI003D9AD982
MLNVDLVFKCGECGSIHFDEDSARECCMPEILEMYQCPICQAVHDEEEDAEQCCGVETARCPACFRTYGRSSIDVFAIKVAGHCRTCNPAYSYDDQFRIEQLHFQATENYVSLNK